MYSTFVTRQVSNVCALIHRCARWSGRGRTRPSRSGKSGSTGTLRWSSCSGCSPSSQRRRSTRSTSTRSTRICARTARSTRRTSRACAPPCVRDSPRSTRLTKQRRLPAHPMASRTLSALRIRCENKSTRMCIYKLWPQYIQTLATIANRQWVEATYLHYHTVHI